MSLKASASTRELRLGARTGQALAGAQRIDRRMSVVSRASGVVARRISTTLTATMIARPPTRAGIAPVGRLDDEHERRPPQSTVALGTSSRQNSET